MQKVARPFSQLNRVRSAHYLYNKNNNVVNENELRIEVTQMKIKPQHTSTLEKMQIKRSFSLIDKLILRVNNMRVENEHIQKDITNYDLIIRDLVHQCDQLYSNHKALTFDQKSLDTQIKELEMDRSEPCSFGVFRNFMKETSEKVEFVGKQVFDQQQRIKQLFLKHDNKQLHEKALQKCIDMAKQIQDLQDRSLQNKLQISDLARVVSKEQQIGQVRVLWAELEALQREIDLMLGAKNNTQMKPKYGMVQFPVQI